MKHWLLGTLAIGFFLILSSCNGIDKGYENVTFYTFEGDELIRPTDYRTWVFVGAPVTPNELNNGLAPFPEIHSVYIDPISYDHYKATGEFRDGTIMIKELVSVGDKVAPSGNGYFMGEFIGLEATIKDKTLFPDEPGNWAYFSFTNHDEPHLKERGVAFKTAQCNICHDVSAADDFVFTQYYPVLSAAKGVGAEVVPENSSRRGMGPFSVMHMNEDPKDKIWQAGAPTPEGLELDLPLDKEVLFTFLSEKKYEGFKAKEKGRHPSAGPHSKLGLPVRVFMNDAIVNSLEAQNNEHPTGSAIVKEMYDKNNTLAGWAVMVKTQETTAGGDGWFWYEVTSTEDPNSLQAIGNGVIGCTSCHMIGAKDMVKTSFPFQN